MLPQDYIHSEGDCCGPQPECALSDELIDELDASMQQLGRILGSRHGDFDGCPALTGPRFMAVRALADGPKRVSDVAAILGVKAPAASAMVDHLCADGLVERADDPDDRRVTIVSLTTAGRETFEQAEEQRRTLMRRYCSVLSEEDVRDLIRIQSTLVEAMLADRI